MKQLLFIVQEVLNKGLVLDKYYVCGVLCTGVPYFKHNLLSVPRQINYIHVKFRLIIHTPLLLRVSIPVPASENSSHLRSSTLVCLAPPYPNLQIFTFLLNSFILISRLRTSEYQRHLWIIG